MKRIKWENIFLLIILPLTIYSLIIHTKENGFNIYILIEAGIYLIIPIVISQEIKSIRKGELK